MRKKIFTQPVNVKLKEAQLKVIDNICEELEINKTDFIRSALDEKINQYLVSAK